MKVLFIGCVEFSQSSLEKLIEIGANIVGVITKEKSKFNSDFVDLSDCCKSRHIPYFYSNDVNSTETLNWVKKVNPDIVYCFGWSSLLGSEFLSLPPKGVVGYHPASLPNNRGRHPIIWALVLGLTETASTFFMMDEGADSGDIISQEIVKITNDDDARTLYDKLVQVSLKQISLFHRTLIEGTASFKKQDHTRATYWRKRTKDDGRIDFRMTSVAIYNLTRALTRPYVGAHILYGKDEIKVWRVRPEKAGMPNLEPGKVLSVKNREIVIKTFDGAIRLLDHEFVELPKVGEYV